MTFAKVLDDSPSPRKHFPSFGPYRLMKTIGEGEFGKVKIAEHKQSLSTFAVKLIKKTNIQDPDKKLKLMREISILKQLNHPHIVKLHEVLETDSYIGMIMDYANGGELFEFILLNRYLKEKDGCKFFAQLISGVSYLHRNGIVHRDLKLENLLLDKDRNLVITDFGFANRFNSDSLMRTSCGSPCYAAPELVVSDSYRGDLADIWSCGVILYSMLCGYLPYDDDPNNPEGDNINQLYQYITQSTLEYPAYVPVLAVDLMKQMMVPNPEKRATMKQVLSHKWLDLADHVISKERSYYQDRGFQVEEIEIPCEIPARSSSLIIEQVKSPQFLVDEMQVIQEELVDTDPVRKSSLIAALPGPPLNSPSEPRMSLTSLTALASSTVNDLLASPTEVASPHTEAEEDMEPRVSLDSFDQLSIRQDECHKMERFDSVGAISNISLEPTPKTVHLADIPTNRNTFIEALTSNFAAAGLGEPVSRSSPELPQIPKETPPLVDYDANDSIEDILLSSELPLLPEPPSLPEQPPLPSAESSRDVKLTSPMSDKRVRFSTDAAQVFQYDSAEQLYRKPSMSRSLSEPSTKSASFRPVSAVSVIPEFKMNLHRGPIDKNALVSKNPMHLILEIEQTLCRMGFTTKLHPRTNFKLIVTRPAALVKVAADSLNSNASLLQKIAAKPRQLVDRMKFITEHRFSWNKGFDGNMYASTERMPVGPNTPFVEKWEKELVFTLEIQRIRDLKGIYVVDFKRKKGDLFEFKNLYQDLIVQLPLV